MNQQTLRRAFRTNEFLVGVTIVLLSIFIGIVNPAYFALSNIFDLLRNVTVMGIFAIGVLIVIISGGIDVSFTAIAAFAMYSTVKALLAVAPDVPMIAVLALSALIGLGLGLINAFFISFFKLPTLIVTLGTLSMFRGFLLSYIGNRLIIGIPDAMIDFSRLTMVTIQTARGVSRLHPAFLLLLGVAIVTWFLLRYTMLGRSIYALGGAPEAAQRAGFNIRKIHFFIYGYVGLLSGVAGILHSSLARVADPSDIVGTELTVIAAVVLGGARITGGYGTVVGTLLGVLLVTVMNTSLILLGIPSYWQQVVIGLLIIIGTGIPAIQNRRAERTRGTVIA